MFHIIVISAEIDTNFIGNSKKCNSSIIKYIYLCYH